MAEDQPAELNSSHKLHLLSSAQYADKLLAEVEAVLFASKSKSPFKRYRNQLPPAQIKVVEDYVARIRTQMIQVLRAQGIPVPEPSFESIHSIRVTLAFARIAFQECTPSRMRGYGAIPESKLRELNGLVDEMVGAVDKLDSYLAQGLGQDLEARLKRLGSAGADTRLTGALEKLIAKYGLVEFRSTLSMIIDRLEATAFEIAFFGRVSSGKSSLLNHIVQSDILPVGVNPITAVPTRLVYGREAHLTVTYADSAPEHLSTDRLPDFVTEEHNPANYKHVTRIVVELPSAKLRDGVVLVDTPGLGSLATSGAAETLAYLPRCDLGVVLIDAGSTLTQDDLSTIRILYEAGVPASVLLSKSDLLGENDRRQSLAYVAHQIRTELGLTLAVRPISVEAAHLSLLDEWTNDVLVPLYDRHQQLAQDSLRRKIGSLREAVETALRIRLDRADANHNGGAPHYDFGDGGQVDMTLRAAVGRIAETREICAQVSYGIREMADQAWLLAAAQLADRWLTGSEADPTPIVVKALLEASAEQVGKVFSALRDLAGELDQALHSAAETLGFQQTNPDESIVSLIKEMPRLDPGPLELDLRRGWLLKISKTLFIRRTARNLTSQAGATVGVAFTNLGRMLDGWMRRTLSEMQYSFEAQADAYRAHLDRTKARGEGPHIGEDAATIEGDLGLLSQPADSDFEEMPTAS
jgi:GTP-binding protein EngB required for normal cell division